MNWVEGVPHMRPSFQKKGDQSIRFVSLPEFPRSHQWQICPNGGSYTDLVTFPQATVVEGIHQDSHRNAPMTFTVSGCSALNSAASITLPYPRRILMVWKIPRLFLVQRSRSIRDRVVIFTQYFESILVFPWFKFTTKKSCICFVQCSSSTAFYTRVEGFIVSVWVFTVLSSIYIHHPIWKPHHE